MVQTIKAADRDKFVAVLAREKTGKSTSEIVDLAGRLIRWGRAHGRLMEAACNYCLSPAQDRQVARLCKRVKVACEPFGIVPVFSGDPRGATVKLKLKSGIADDWGGVGLCVPGS